jgi:hypothetical protein
VVNGEFLVCYLFLVFFCEGTFGILLDEYAESNGFTHVEIGAEFSDQILTLNLALGDVRLGLNFH